jgi:hypothetical protein
MTSLVGALRAGLWIGRLGPPRLLLHLGQLAAGGPVGRCLLLLLLLAALLEMLAAADAGITIAALRADHDGLP